MKAGECGGDGASLLLRRERTRGGGESPISEGALQLGSRIRGGLRRLECLNKDSSGSEPSHAGDRARRPCGLRSAQPGFFEGRTLACTAI